MARARANKLIAFFCFGPSMGASARTTDPVHAGIRPENEQFDLFSFVYLVSTRLAIRIVTNEISRTDVHSANSKREWDSSFRMKELILPCPT